MQKKTKYLKFKFNLKILHFKLKNISFIVMSASIDINDDKRYRDGQRERADVWGK